MAKKLNDRQRALKEQRTAKRRAEAKRKRVFDEIKKILIALTVIAVLTCAVWGVITGINNYKSSHAYQSKQIAFSTEHFSITNSQLAYFYYEGYHGFVDMYGASLDSYGLNTEQKLSKQSFTMNDSYETWHDYFLDSAKSQIKQLLSVAEYAVSQGYELSDEQKNAIKIRAERLNYNDYPQVDVDDAYACFELMTLALNYQYSTQQSMIPSEEEAEDYYANTSVYYDRTDLRTFSISYSEDGGEGELTQEQALKYANKFKKCSTDEEFTEQIYDYLDSVGKFTDGETNAENNRNTIVSNSYTTDYEYTEGGDIVTEWIFDSSRKAGDVYVYDNEGSLEITAYMITSPPAPSEAETRTVRHILFRSDTYGSAEEALKKAEAVKAELDEAGGGEAKFATLALAYSDDAASCYIGGEYFEFAATDFSSGSDETMKKFTEWCFDENRKTGEYEIVESSYGYHLVYFISEGPEEYIADVRADIMSNDYTEISDLIQAVTVTETGKGDKFRSKL